MKNDEVKGGEGGIGVEGGEKGWVGGGEVSSRRLSP